MKKTYITPEVEIVNIELESMIAASTSISIIKDGSASDYNILEADINARAWFENTMDNDLLW
ncbi:MAG: hypothetical protein IKD25_01830 [Bacteroidaceae bacterium]|nr:hypothetical protein [Bacteroidaceae bacterium]